jgi:hypothetical protein
MTMTIGLSTALRNSRLQAIADALNLDMDEYEEYDCPKLLLYSGTRPATGEVLDEYDGDLLATFSLPYPCGTIVNGVFTFGTVPNTVGEIAGTVAWGRLVDLYGDFVADLSVTASGGGGDCIIDNVVIGVGDTIVFVSGTITEGNA